MSPKVRDLAESRTGVLASMYIAIARGKYYKYALAARGGWPSFLHIFILIHEWSRFVWTSDKWFLSLQGNDAPSGNEIMLLEGNNEFHQGHAMPLLPALMLPFFLIDANMHKQILKRFRHHNGHLLE